MSTKQKAEKKRGATDEEIVVALLQNGTQRAAAAAVGVDERTIYNRMQNTDFRALYQSAKVDIIRSAVFTINEYLSTAVQTVVEVMQNEENNPAIRLQAAQTILNNAGKFAERLANEEQKVKNEIESKDFFEM